MEEIHNISKVHVGGRQYLPPDEMIFLESSSNYTNLFCCNGKHIIVATTLGHIEERLSSFEAFLRINRSTLINVEYVNEIHLSARNTYVISMKDGKKFTVSRRRIAHLKMRFPAI